MFKKTSPKIKPDFRIRDLLWLARKSLSSRKTRSRFTIIAMVIGVGFLTFLYSMGYGVQRLVVSQITSLHSLKTADIFPRDVRFNKIDEKAIKDFKNISDVETVEPLISLIGKGEFQGSSFDIAIFGATTNYLKFSDIQPLYGNFYNSNELNISELKIQEEYSESFNTENLSSKSQEENEKDKIIFNIKEGEWIKLREKPSLKGRVIGYTKRKESLIKGKEVRGEKYLVNVSNHLKADISEKYSNDWIYAEFPVWKKDPNGSYSPLLINGEQKKTFAYIGENFIEQIEETDKTSELSLIDSSQGKKQKDNLANLIKFAVVNEATIKAMGIENIQQILGNKINIIFKTDKNEEAKVQNIEIVGVIGGVESPAIYLPFVDLRLMGIEEFSQAKMVVTDKNKLAKAREKVENMGFQTESAADTVERVNNLFRIFNIALAIFGLIALIIATLGMFNTLIVSLLERTREIGIMKAIGMKRREVMLLFFLEAGTMGFWGGFLGCIGGFLFGQIINLLLNIFLVPPARRFIFIFSIPWYLPIIFIVFALLISVLTAIIPARRAAKISSLGAIRYE